MNALHLPNAEFRSLAARVTDLAADLLAGLDELRAFPAVRGEQVARVFEAPLPEEGLRAGALDALGEVLALSRAPTPRFYGYVLGSGEPVAALADLLASIPNQNVTACGAAPAPPRTAQRDARPWPWSPPAVASTPARSIHCRRSPRCAANSNCGCMWTARTARWRRSPSRNGSPA